MFYWTLVKTFIFVLILSIVGTMVLEYVFRFLGVRGYMGNLFPNVRGGIPKAVGVLPFILLSLLLLPNYNLLVLIIGIFAFIDDIFGKSKAPYLKFEIGPMSRLIGFVLVILIGVYSGLGLASILIALMVQPISVSDMQPGSACMVTFIMCLLTLGLLLILGTYVNNIYVLYSVLVIFFVVLGYCPLDFSGRVMLGSVGNHSLAVALGCAFYMVGGSFWLVVLFIITLVLTAFIRRNTIYPFLINNIGIPNPNVGDLFMDILSGGTVCDLLRKFFLENQQPMIKNKFLIKLGFRRLVYNPYAPKNRRYDSNYRNSFGLVIK